jgi:ATP-dependent 26S proteasome regulatory subunit
MIASQMGDTRYRGRIVWMLLTCRPDLLPIDLKRQGRAEVHLPLFYPQDQAEVRAMFDAMARKNRVPLQSEMNLAALPKWKLSGADLESVLLLARRAVTAAGRSEVTGEDIAAALADFIPSVQGLEKELQEVAAVLECTQLSLLPAEWRKRVGEPDGRTQLQERLVELRRLIEE